MCTLHVQAAATPRSKAAATAGLHGVMLRLAKATRTCAWPKAGCTSPHWRSWPTHPNAIFRCSCKSEMKHFACHHHRAMHVGSKACACKRQLLTITAQWSVSPAIHMKFMVLACATHRVIIGHFHWFSISVAAVHGS